MAPLDCGQSQAHAGDTSTIAQRAALALGPGFKRRFLDVGERHGHVLGKPSLSCTDIMEMLLIPHRKNIDNAAISAEMH